ncbi:MAG: glycoside hydrolase family 43 protein [Mobilitalea sp.]
MRKKLIVMSCITTLIMSLFLSGCSKQKEITTDTAVTENSTQEEADQKSMTEAAPTPEVFVTEEAEIVEVEHAKVSVHDPSIVKANGRYYIFGSHMAWAKSEDLMNWTTFRNNINTDYEQLLGGLWEDYCKSASNPNLGGNLWAPDVIYNKAMGKYCMYMSVNGDNWNSAIALLTADDIEGPYEYKGVVVYSGFSKNTVKKTDVPQVLGEDADIARYESTKNTKLNAIDPNVKYDEEGNLWMVFGSWFGGLYMIKLDSETGLRDYEYTFATVENESDQYYGYKIAGGWGVSGEGAYINKFGDYYYLFVSYGGLTAQGGYQMRVFRSEKIMGPYVDQKGESSVYTKATNNLTSIIGVRLMGAYKFTGNTETCVAQGHNSILLDEDGKMYVVYHTRFQRGTKSNPETHEVYVHQMFLTEDDWLVAAPYEYSEETISATGYEKKEVVGEYEFVVHTPNMYYQIVAKKEIGIAQIQNIALYSDGTVSGDLTGTWSNSEGTADMTITIDGVEYKGVFVKQINETDNKVVMTFTAIGGNVCVMGSKK